MTIRIRTIALGAALAVLASAPAFAQATRTWVSGVGDDVNPCSRTAPCKTFAGAISKTASGGEIDVLDPGGFGAVTITKPITIDGAGQFGSILASSVNGIVVNIAATTPPPNVVLRNLSINGAGTTLGTNGVNVTSGVANLQLENVQISNFSQNGVRFASNNGVFVSKLTVVNSVISDVATGFGILVAPQAGRAVADINNVVSVRNQGGLRAQDNATVVVQGGSFSENSAAGINAIPSLGSPTVIEVKNAIVANNNNGIGAGAATATVSLSNVGVYGNTVKGTFNSGGALISFGNNQIRNNPANDPFTQTLPQQ